MEELELVTQHIERILSEKPYELCARLKQRLNFALHRAGYEAFDEGKLGYKKFSGFLVGELSDKLRVERPDGASGDLKISLKCTELPLATKASGLNSTRARSSGIRPDIFLAFINPDPSRRRFWDRDSGKVLHFEDGANDKYAQIMESRPDDFIEIDWIPAQEQVGWMRAFVELLPPEEQAAVEPLLAGAFTGGMNAAFTNALGAKASDWRQIRMFNISAHITAWEVKHDVKLAEAGVKAAKEALDRHEDTSNTQQLMTARQQAIGLLERISEDQIAKVAIPTLLSLFLSMPQR